MAEPFKKRALKFEVGEKMTKIEKIKKRKSVRKYDMAQLDESVLLQIEVFLKETKPLIEGAGAYQFKIISRDEFYKNTGGFFRIESPHYVVFFGDGSDEALKNIGYVGELLCLELVANDIGTCWLGGVRAKKLESNENYCISIAFGKSEEKFRTASDKIKRKALIEIATGYDQTQEQLLELARLAPSAINLQPWYFKCEPSKIHIFRKNAKLLGIIILTKMQKIDIGIVISHLATDITIYEKLDSVTDKKMTYEGTVFL